MPVMTIERKHSGTAVKLHRVVHMGMLQSGADKFKSWRFSQRGFCSDQGSAERGIPKAPFPKSNDDEDEIAQILLALKY